MAADRPTDWRTGALALARRFGPLLVIVVAVTAIFASGLTRHLSMRDLAARRELLEAAVRAHPVLSLCAYIGVYTLLVAASVPAALIMTLTGGLLFGPWIGGMAAAISCTLGGTAIFFVCRTALGDTLKRRAGPRMARITQGLRQDAFSYVVMLRLVPIAPFWLVNLALSLIDIPPVTYVAASFLGILPVSVVYAGLGSELNLLLARGIRPNLHLFLRPRLLAPMIGLALLALAPVIVRHWKKSIES